MNTQAIDSYLKKVAQLVVCNATLSDQHLHLKFPQEAFLSEIPGFQIATSLTELLKLYRGVVMVVGQTCIHKTEGLRDRFFVPIDKAMHYYRQGATLEFDFVERFFPGLQKFILKLKTLLQLPNGALGKAICYASPHAGGFPMHFDAYYNFIFQITGKKKWILQPNDNVALPLQHYDLHEYPYLPTELKSYWQEKAKPPLDGIDQAIIEELEAGSMLYLPRGVWHQTDASACSFSLNITFSIPTVLDLLLAALRKKMAPHRINRMAPLHIDKKDYELYIEQLKKNHDQLKLSDFIEQLHIPHDSYQQGNKAFHAILEFLKEEG